MKRYIKRWISFILFMCVFVWYPSDGVVMAADSGQKNIDIVGTASMNTYDVALRVGKTKQLVCNGTTGKMVWKSSNPKVATVDKKGLVKAIKPGKAMISVSGGNLIGSMTCKVGVSKKITTKQARRKIMAMKKTYKEVCPGQTKTGSISGKPRTVSVMDVLPCVEKSVIKCLANMHR